VPLRRFRLLSPLVANHFASLEIDRIYPSGTAGSHEVRGSIPLGSTNRGRPDESETSDGAGGSALRLFSPRGARQPVTPIGFVRHDHAEVPRHWTVSDLEGELRIDETLLDGLRDIEPGQRIVVLFEFHRSPPFDPAQHLRQTPPHRDRRRGVFSICSPLRPNPIGLSVLEVLRVEGGTIAVRGVDMLDGTPILDIKPHIQVEG
jgi:tRNA-Thr(GGU) m(6)t(6)A37 methyltransferase TsaA